MALLTWAEYCAYEGSDPGVTDDQARIEKLIASATAVIEKYCNRLFDPMSRTVVGQWKSSVTLKAIPITAFQVFVDTTETFAAETEVTTGYWLDKVSGILAWNMFYSTQALVKIVYTGGMVTIPEDLKEAVFKVVKWDKSRIFTGQVGIRSTVQGEITTSYDTALPYEVRQILDSYWLP